MLDRERQQHSAIERQRIETIPQAAAAFVATHRELTAHAIHLTDAYLDRQCLGDEGTTWQWGNLGGQGKAKVPFLDPVLSSNDWIILGGTFDIQTGKLVSPYTIQKKKDPDAGIIVESTGWNKDSGYDTSPYAYIINASGISEVKAMREEPDDTGSYPTGRLDYEQAQPLTTVTEDLLQTIEDVTEYRKV